MADDSPQPSSAPSPGTQPAVQQPATARRRKPAAEKNADVRAGLEPLAPGERPGAVTIAALVAAALAISNIVAYFAGAKPDAADTADVAVQLVLVTAILGMCAVGMWLVKYWAVLGFQTLLALQMLVSALALLRANSLPAVGIWLALMVAAGVLFWYLIRAMARIQMPEPPDSAALEALRNEVRQREAAREGLPQGQNSEPNPSPAVDVDAKGGPHE